MIDITKDADGIAVLSFNMVGQPMNVINEQSSEAFKNALEQVLADKEIKGVIITSSRPEFIAGADLNMILGLNNTNEVVEMTGQLHKLFRAMEKSGKPFVAAINGTALGGGYELCLACHYRVCVDDARIQIGLPEVQLGLLPGGGGTQRLPRLIGMQAALQNMLEGKRLRPAQAKSEGMVDQLVATKDELIPAAKKWILEVGKKVQPWDVDGYKVPGGGVQSPNGVMVFTAGAALLMKKTFGNYPAAQYIMNCVYEGMQLPFDKALDVEARYFAKAVMSKESKHMIRTLFFTLNEANKGAARPKEIGEIPLKKVGILGAGMMGAGIAYVSADAGLEVVLKDVSLEAAAKGKSYAEKLWGAKLSKGFMTQEKYDGLVSRIKATDSAADLAGCDLIIEAVFEDRGLKATVTKESEPHLNPTGVFASNTSTLPITGLAEASAHPDKFIGLHFFSPVDKMPLVEIILGKETSDYAIAMAVDYVKKIKKTPIVVNDGRGFFTSRNFSTYVAEGLELLNEGVAPALIDNAGKAAGMPVGPLAVADEVTIELMYKIIKQTEKDTGVSLDSAQKTIATLFVEKLDRIGKKAGKGFYEYPEGGKKFLWPGLAEHFPVKEGVVDIETAKTRLLYRQVIEAVKCMEEGIVTSPKDADIGSIFGWGFAPYSGGVISFLDFVGYATFVATADKLADTYGERFRPTDKLRAMAANGESYYSKAKELEVA